MKSESLLITTKNQGEHNPLQLEFNKIILQLEQYDKKLEKTKAILDEKLIFTKSYLIPLQTKLAIQSMEMNKYLFNHYKTWNLSSSKKELLGWFVMDHINITLSDSFGIEQKDQDELNAMYDKLHLDIYGTEYKEDAEDSMDKNFFEEITAYMESQLKQDGINVDLSGLKASMSDEEMEEYLKGQQENFAPFSNQNHASKRKSKKSKKNTEKELLKTKMEELRNQNISTIFKKIAKVLHPDLEQDPIARAQKEELMKQLTGAYEKKDLRTMLKLEMEWVMGEKDKLDQLTDDKLTVFIELLKEQLQELKNSIRELSNHTLYRHMYAFAEFHVDLTKWKPVIKLNEMKFLYHQNARSLEVIKVDNRLCKDTVMAWIEEYKQNDQMI